MTRAAAAHANALHEVPMQPFIASRAEALKRLALDVDATHAPLHGDRERGHFHACHDHHCYLPLYAFAGQDLLACVLRPSDRDAARAESRIKEAQLDLFGRHASCHRFQANQLRLLLAALASTLIINLRRLALNGTEPARARTATIRMSLLKIGAAIVRMPVPLGRTSNAMVPQTHPVRRS